MTKERVSCNDVDKASVSIEKVAYLYIDVVIIEKREKISTMSEIESHRILGEKKAKHETN